MIQEWKMRVASSLPPSPSLKDARQCLQSHGFLYVSRGTGECDGPEGHYRFSFVQGIKENDAQNALEQED